MLRRSDSTRRPTARDSSLRQADRIPQAPSRGAFVRGDLARPVTLLAVLLVLQLGAHSSAAQDGGITATLRGIVQDDTGAVLPGAQVTLTNTGTKALQTLATDERGAFVFAGLWPGTYDLKIELSGFKTLRSSANIVLSPNDTRVIDVQLEIGSQTGNGRRRPRPATSSRPRPGRARAC